MDDFRIFICYSDTGGGHRSAADAVRVALEELIAKSPRANKVEIMVETVVEKSNRLNTFFVDLYNFLLRNRQDWMKYYIQFIEVCKPNQRLIGYLGCKDFLRKLYARTRPSVVVSVHPMVNHYMAMARRDAGMEKTTKLVVVLTDPNGNLWSGWACKDADILIAPNDLAHDQLVKLGIKPEKIKTIGMPIEPAFVHPAKIERDKVLQSLGLDPGKITVLLSGGWAGGGPLLDIYDALIKVKRPTQVVILCGKNEALKEKMTAHSHDSPVPTVVMGFVESLSDLFNAGDLLVTKAGGLTTFEAVARRLPLAFNLLTEPMPQEMGTVEMLIKAGLAQGVKKNDDIIAIVENLIPVKDRQLQALPKEHNLDRVDAIYEIAQTILDLDKCPQPVN
jgi:UDP-N-acetylglucosamine:LPS N-acetylglucosamine transferase